MKNTNTQIEKMKEQTIGVEIEMNNITREKAAKKVAEYFGTTAWDAARQYGYCAWACKDQQGRVWKFQRDVSIAGPEAEKCEMVTPILTYQDIETLQEIVRLLRKAGAKSDSTRGCGVHIHIGANGHTPQTLRTLANIMASHEMLISEALDIDSGRMDHYCKVVDRNFLNMVNRRKPKTMAKFADIWYETQHQNYGRHDHYNGSRYHMLNYHATFTKGTIEFRLFQFNNPGHNFKGGLHAGMLKSYIQLCLALCDRAKKIKSATYKPLVSQNDKYTMRVWLLHLGFIGDEFKTARDILTRNLTGNAAHRYGVNGNEFGGVA